jgi:glycerol-3-phosphate acyltransferase PlsX
MITIAVDAMGGDHSPQNEVEGAVLAAREDGVRVALVGLEEPIRYELARHSAEGLAIDILPASEVITMDDNPIKALRSKKGSSLHVAANAMKEGKVQGLVTAGNTGAAMAITKRAVGMVPGVDRPALASVFPTRSGVPSVLLDVGANVDCKPQHLQQFAVMGEVYYRVMFGVDKPRVGLLSIGEEEHKGNEVVREAHRRLRDSKLRIDFVGNVEGRDVFSGDVHVVVCDGFIGNVALKISEGMVEAITSMLREAMNSTVSAQVGYMLSRQAYDIFKRRLDYSEYGGVPLLGIKGVCIICHGRSNANAVKNAILVAASFSEGKVNEKIESELGLLAAAG